jgi:hypothetical protein
MELMREYQMYTAGRTRYTDDWGRLAGAPTAPYYISRPISALSCARAIRPSKRA